MQRPAILLLLAAISFLPALGFYMVGEEGSLTISALEMRLNGNWQFMTFHGRVMPRPPLMSWLVIPIAELIGWSNVLVATRLVSVAATLGITAWLYWLCRKLFNDKTFALFAALAYLSLADLLLYRGWLAYTDPTFAFFTFGAMATLWVACTGQHRGWLIASVLLVSCALLSKAFTAYVFYGTAALVLLWQRPYRSFLLSPSALCIFGLASLMPFAWFSAIPQLHGHSSSMLNEIARKLSVQDLASYLENFITFPLDTAFRLSPAVLLALYLLLRKRVQPETAPVHFQAALLTTGFCFLPYWLSPQNSIRYLLPIYPLIALVSARIIWRAGEPARNIALRWFSGVIAFKFVFALVLAPYYQSHYRGENYAQAANAIIKRTNGFPLYANDDRATSLSVVGYIDAKRYPQAPVKWLPTHFDSGFLLAMEADPLLGELTETYNLAFDQMLLLCRGTACNTTPANNK